MAGKKAPRKIYWDTCIFLAWIKQENCWPEEVMKGIEQIIEQSLSREVVIITSVITLAEILQSKMTVDEKDKFSKAFSDPRLQLVDVDRRISGKAAVIRQECDTTVLNADGSKKSGSIMAMGDALHLATAVHIGVYEFQTLDGAGKAKRLDLLRLDGNVALSRLTIRQPKYVPPPPPLEGPMEPDSDAAQMILPNLAGTISEASGADAQTGSEESSKAAGASHGVPNDPVATQHVPPETKEIDGATIDDPVVLQEKQQDK